MAGNSEDVFTFLSLRPIRQPQGIGRTHGVIRDNSYEGATITNGGGLVGAQLLETDLYSTASPSMVGRATFNSIRLGKSPMGTAHLVKMVLVQSTSAPSGLSLAPIVTELRLVAADAARLSSMAGRPQVAIGERIIVFPAVADHIAVPLTNSLSRLRVEVDGIIAEMAKHRNYNQDRPQAAASLPSPVLPSLVTKVFSLQGGSYTADYQASKRILFDAVYGLTVLRKVYPADPAPAIAGLQTLHAMERLAIAMFALHTAQVREDATAMANLNLLAATLQNAWPDLSFGTEHPEIVAKRLIAAQMPCAWDTVGFATLMQSHPVIPPMFVRLRGAFQPFNTLRPVGIGDLMVVRQTFVGYRKGEIARVETVMAGEEKDRTLRRMDRVEDSQTFAFSEDSETTSEISTAERFELKREAEFVLKTDVNVGLNATVTYNGSPVVSTVSANASLSVGKSDSEKLAQSFARDVTERALSRVQRRASQSRSRTLVTETEDTAIHRFKASAGQSHVNGFYRWVDKIYSAEVRNYGRRLMFELIVPEPAAFYVQSRLLAHIAALNLPDYPQKPEPETTNTQTIMGVTQASDINAGKWVELNQSYYLDHLPPPPATIGGIDIVDQNGARNFSKRTTYKYDGDKVDKFYSCRANNPPPGYAPARLQVHGSASYAGVNETPANWQNEFAVKINGITMFSTADERSLTIYFDGANKALPSGFVVNDTFEVDFITKTCKQFNAVLMLEYDITEVVMQDWRAKVFSALVPARLRPTNAGTPLADPEVENYLKTLRETERASVRQVIQGGSSAWNRRRMEQEIKRLSISQFTREFDVQATDDQISNFETMGKLPVRNYTYPRLTIKEGNAAKRQTAVTFDAPPRELGGYDVPDVGLSHTKGVHVQFMEHAFEWTNLSYVFYPYYWATPPKWVELLDREDEADPSFTDFLQAGAARVLIAVRPGFENAVMHYLATREPWDGGAAPIIGDDLHLPVHEEIRELTEDRAGTGLAVGEPWLVTVPTSLLYLESVDHPLPDPYVPPATPV